MREIEGRERSERPALERLLSGTASRRFAADFDDRVLQRVRSTESLDAELVRQFVRLAAAAVVAAALLAAFSLSVAERSDEQSVLEAALGLQPRSLIDTYTLDPMSLFENEDAS